MTTPQHIIKFRCYVLFKSIQYVKSDVIFRSFRFIKAFLIADFLPKIIIGNYVFDLSISDVGSFLLRIKLKSYKCEYIYQNT